MGKHLDICRCRCPRRYSVVFVADHLRHAVTIFELGSFKHPHRRIANHPIGFDGVAFVIRTREGTLGVCRRALAERSSDALVVCAVEGVPSRIAIVDLESGLSRGGVFKTNPAVDVVRSEESNVDASISSGFKVLAHLDRVVLVMSRDDDAAVVLGQFPALMEIDIGPIGNVVTGALNERDELPFATKKFAAAVSGVGTIKTHDVSTSVCSGVDACTAPAVVGLPGRNSALH